MRSWVLRQIFRAAETIELYTLATGRNTMNFLQRSVVTLGAACLALSAGAAAPAQRAGAPAAGAPAAKPSAGRPGPSPVAPAILALQKEYQKSLKEKDGAGLREKCDFFAGGKPEGVTPEVILAALEKPLTGPGAGDARADAYVKWQLLSGIDGKFPEELKARAIKAYRVAPVPKEHPGGNHAALDRALYKIGITNADAEVGVNKDLTTAIDQYRLYIDPILEYRDEFYRRLPGGFDTLVAGVQDTYDRVSRGAPASEFWKTVGGQIRSWALTSSDANQIRQMAGAILKLNEFVRDGRNKPYYRVMWVNEGKYTGLKWQSQSTIDQEGRYVGELGEWLEERAKNPSAEGGLGGLQFKDDDDMKKGKKK